MTLWKNKKRDRAVRLDRRPEAPGNNWPVFDLDLVEAATKESMFVARLFKKVRRWENLKRR